MRPGTTYQQRLEWACIFEDTCKAFIYLPSSTAEQYTADKYCQVGKKKKLILIAILMLRADMTDTGKLMQVPCEPSLALFSSLHDWH